VRKQRVNEDIRLTPIGLIDEDNKQVGVVETPDAMRMAREAGLDLVEIQPDVRPPGCKIMDYGKYRFELSKKERGNRAASKQAEMKEVRLGRSQKIDEHDVEIRVNQARRFLMDGHKVQLVQNFRGREITHKEIAFARFNKIVQELSDVSKVETPPRQMGRRMSMILAPDKPKIDAIKRREAKEREAAQQKGEPAGDANEEPTSSGEVEQSVESPAESAKG